MLPANSGFSIALIRSEDRGGTWGGPGTARPTIVDRHFPGVVVDSDDGDILPEVAVDRSTGAIYVVWQDARSGHGAAWRSPSRSTGGGPGPPTIKINTTPTGIPVGNQQAFTPMVRVSSDGTIGVSYYDFRNNTANPDTLPTDTFLVHCHPVTPTTCADPANWGGEI